MLLTGIRPEDERGRIHLQRGGDIGLRAEGRIGIGIQFEAADRLLVHMRQLGELNLRQPLAFSCGAKMNASHGSDTRLLHLVCQDLSVYIPVHTAKSLSLRVFPCLRA